MGILPPPDDLTAAAIQGQSVRGEIANERTLASADDSALAFIAEAHTLDTHSKSLDELVRKVQEGKDTTNPVQEINMNMMDYHK
jgi:hypothetical protein